MKASVTTGARGPDGLKVCSWPDPQPRTGEVVVKVAAAGVNFADVLAAMGLYPDAPKLPAVMGYEVAGVVERVGPGVSGIAPGDRVFGGTKFGGHAETAVAEAGALLPMPSGWSPEEAAAVPVAYATAYAALCRFGSLMPGERVLVHAAAGGVGRASTQLALALDAEVFGTASSGKQGALREAGVHHPIDYQSEDFLAAVRRITGTAEPLDLVMDAIDGRSMRRSWRLLGPGGRLVCFGASSLLAGDRRKISRVARVWLQLPRFSALSLMTQSKSVIGLNVLRIWNAKGSLEELIDPLRGLIEQKVISPAIAETFPLERVADAYRLLIERRNVGKVVLSFG